MQSQSLGKLVYELFNIVGKKYSKGFENYFML